MSDLTNRMRSGSVARQNLNSMDTETYIHLRTYVQTKTLLGENEFPNKSNEEVVELYRNKGCDFSQVLLRYHKLLMGKSRQWVMGMTQEDLFQELSLRLHHCCERWDPEKEANFMTYVFEAIDNHIAWIIRKQGKTDKRKANYGEVASYELLVYNGDEEDFNSNEPWAVDNSEFLELISGIDLTDKEELCVKMKFEGHKNKEIAEVLGVTNTRVTQIFRSMQPKFQFMLDEFRTGHVLA